MKKYFVMLCIAAAVAGASSFVVAEDDSNGEKKFVLHGEIRQRADYNDNLVDGTDDTSDSFLFFPYRARIAAEGHFGKGVIGYIEMQGFGFWGDVPPIKDFTFGPVGGDSPDSPFVPIGDPANISAETNTGQLFSNDIELYQAYINLSEIGGSKWDIKIGRQEIVRGTEFLLGDNDFYDGISHDALMGSWNAEHFSLDIWWARPLQSPDANFDVAAPPVTP
ncbi:MAG TPA: alginate export family protein, partial [Candidatus Polarisedimenticolia bacterium]|nr:alginate export family protein [Candidatus Polarisedimenticolia bacterium]